MKFYIEALVRVRHEVDRPDAGKAVVAGLTDLTTRSVRLAADEVETITVTRQIPYRSGSSVAQEEKP